MTGPSPITQTPEELATAPAATVLRVGLGQSPELRRGLAATIVLALAAAVGKLSVPLLVQQTLDTGVDPDTGIDAGRVALLCGVTVSVMALTWAVSVVTFRRLVAASERALAILRHRVFSHVHRLSLADHVERATGSMVTRVTTDIDALARFSEWGGLSWILNSTMILATATVMFVYSWPMALIVLAVFTPLPFAMRWLQQRQLAAHDSLRTVVAAQGGAFSEELGGAALVRAHGLEGRSRDRLRGAVRDVLEARYRTHRYGAISFPVSELFGAAGLSVVVAAGALRGQQWGLELGEVIAFVFLVNLMLGPIAELTEILDQTQTAIAGWRKVLVVLATPIEIVEPEDGRGLPHGPLSVELDGVGFRYRTGDPVLHDLHLDLPAGIDVAIVGETGSGKSTMAKLLVRLADPTEGVVRIGGVPLTEVGPEARRAALRMVPQDGFLFATTIRENVRYGRPDADPDELEAAVDALGLRSWVDKLPEGLDTALGERGGRLSVGERQLVALIRAQLSDPGLLVLDEATSAVDPEIEQALGHALLTLAEGRTTVTVAHRLSTAERADLVLVMDQGRIVQQGTHAELVAEGGVYGRLHASWLGATAV